jgi:hypothetical protein
MLSPALLNSAIHAPVFINFANKYLYLFWPIEKKCSNWGYLSKNIYTRNTGLYQNKSKKWGEVIFIYNSCNVVITEIWN